MQKKPIFEEKDIKVYEEKHPLAGSFYTVERGESFFTTDMHPTLTYESLSFDMNDYLREKAEKISAAVENEGWEEDTEGY